MRYERINPEELGAPRGWTNGMLAGAAGRVLFVAGQDAAGPGGEVETNDFAEQFEIALEKAVTVVREAGGGPESIGRILVFVTSVQEYRDARPVLRDVWRRHMGKQYPAMALVGVSELVDPRGKVELEATAVIYDPGA